MTHLGEIWGFRLDSMFVRLFVGILVRLFVGILVVTSNPEAELVESANTVLAVATASA